MFNYFFVPAMHIYSITMVQGDSIYRLPFSAGPALGPHSRCSGIVEWTKKLILASVCAKRQLHVGG